MSSERVILLVVHTGRDEATDTARRVEKVLSDNGIGLRVLSAEAVDRGSLHLDARRHADPGRRHRGRRRRRTRRRGLRTGAGARRRRHLPAGRRTGPQRRDPGARRQPRAHRLPGRGRGRGHRRRPRPRHLPRLPGRGAHDARHRRPRRTGRWSSRGWALNEASLEKGPRLGVLERRPRDRRPAGLGVRLRRCAGVDARPAPPPTRSRRADRWCGPTSRRSWWCPTTLTRCSRARWSPARTRRSPSRSRRAATTRWCSATAAARCGCPPAAASR